MQRRRPDGAELTWRVVLVGGAAWRRPWPMLVQWETPDDERVSLEPPVAHPNGARGIAGIAIAVANLETASSIYQDNLGLSRGQADDVPALGARRVTYHLGDCAIQLLSPAGPGQLQQVLADWGEGPFELTLTVAGLEQARRSLSAAGVEPTPREGTPAALAVPPDQALGTPLVFEAAGARRSETVGVG